MDFSAFSYYSTLFLIHILPLFLFFHFQVQGESFRTSVANSQSVICSALNCSNVFIFSQSFSINVIYSCLCVLQFFLCDNRFAVDQIASISSTTSSGRGLRRGRGSLTFAWLYNLYSSADRRSPCRIHPIPFFT